MGTQIFLGNPPTNVEQWIKNQRLKEPLCFTAKEAGSTVRMESVNDAGPEVSLEYSTDGNTWSPFQVGSTTVTLANIGDKMYMRATSAGNTGMGCFSSGQGGFIYNRFVMTGKISASGNVDTLLNQNGNATLTFACYYGLFEYCTSLTQAPELPATTLADYCYESMFKGCTSLTTAPELPATTLADSCYSNMFYYCTSLTQAPTIKTYTSSLNNSFTNMLNMWNSSEFKWGQLKQCNWPDLTLSEAESMVLSEGIFGNAGQDGVIINITCKDGSARAYFDINKFNWVFER